MKEIPFAEIQDRIVALKQLELGVVLDYRPHGVCFDWSGVQRWQSEVLFYRGDLSEVCLIQVLNVRKQFFPFISRLIMQQVMSKSDVFRIESINILEGA